MAHYKICVYAISKNEEQFIDRWMDAVSEADLVVVADTGSTDQTIERLRARGALVYPEKISPWRFDEARNRALSHIPEDVDICVSNDLDEIFEAGWRAKLEAAWKPGHTRARYTFVWSHDEKGNILKQFPMEKIHKRHGYRWIHPVHEVLHYEGVEHTLSIPEIVLHHYPDNNKSRSQYLPLLELSAAENPEDDRTRFWLGREYVYTGQYDMGIRTLQGYLLMPTARWDEERSAAMRLIAACHEKRGDKKAAKSWLWRSVGECPRTREPFLALAKFAYSEADWALAALMAAEGLKILHASGSYLTEPEAWASGLYDYGAIACYRLGQYEQALTYAEAALRYAPQDARLQANRTYILEKLPSKANP